jgi:DNA polymerase IV
MIKKIIHVDMDAFFTSVEQRDRPELRNKPVVVGGDRLRRGVVAAASYEARKFGVRSAMSCAKAYRLCPQTIFVSPRFERYSEVSEQIHEIFLQVTPLVEPLSLDEAYLDVTVNSLQEPLASKVAQHIKKLIREKTGLTASAGVAPNKFIAKIASDLKKPNGLVVVPPEKVFQFVENLPVEKFWGVGPKTAEKLYAAGIRTAHDVRKTPCPHLENLLGSYGQFLFELAHGRDDREVEPSSEPKSRGSETTFERDLLDKTVLLNILQELAEGLALELKELGKPGKTITVKIKYHDFETITRSRTVSFPGMDSSFILEIASDLMFRQTEVGIRPVRLLGISVSNFVDATEPIQLSWPF